jgi:hypothetical protein
LGSPPKKKYQWNYQSAQRSGQSCLQQNAGTYLSSCQESYPKSQYYHSHTCLICGSFLIQENAKIKALQLTCYLVFWVIKK